MVFSLRDDDLGCDTVISQSTCRVAEMTFTPSSSQLLVRYEPMSLGSAGFHLQMPARGTVQMICYPLNVGPLPAGQHLPSPSRLGEANAMTILPGFRMAVASSHCLKLIA